jgi:hypothetical protein
METITKTFYKFIAWLFDRHEESGPDETGQSEYERWLNEQW